jgi:hypothetical protein
MAITCLMMIELPVEDVETSLKLGDEALDGLNKAGL